MTIQYEFNSTPELGKTVEITDGVHWLRMPLPFELAHINLWLLEDDDSWVTVDSGMRTEDSQGVWKKTIAELMGDAMLGEAVEYNWLMVLVRADAFRPMTDYSTAAEGFMAEVRGSTPAPGFDKVIMPGERETGQARAAEQAGIVVGDGVWNGIVEAARSVGVEPGDYV